MKQVEVVYDASFAGIDAVREQVWVALARADLPPRWQEWKRDDTATPGYAKHCRSPSVLIDGDEVPGCCACGSRDSAAVPDADAIVAALKKAGHRQTADSAA